MKVWFQFGQVEAIKIVIDVFPQVFHFKTQFEKFLQKTFVILNQEL